MRLITEEVTQAKYIVEERDGKKNYAIKGVFLQSDVKNKNGRICQSISKNGAVF